MEQDFHRQGAKQRKKGIGFKNEVFYTLKIYIFYGT